MNFYNCQIKEQVNNSHIPSFAFQINAIELNEHISKIYSTLACAQTLLFCGGGKEDVL